ncbi:LysR family transcriptional regulator [Bradyrhizobium sp. LHD-71]|uniref:LysR family transcriptional regulator n=1 Tax=Bradyrhizobium sp. LHD-71 TaxID=3072141 RepID=UPI00280EAB3C|nr:LysR family transcriptional regulator [Bradyrhizobium sp. LHD-71]MDQ8726654.1 LysR family transcriptional regulator [Bradyrhizobium sp. LHD-71]
MNITSNDLLVFLTLVQEKSFTRAAARCGLSQSAFSTRISSLEHALGAKLFDRTTRRVELTPDGEVFEPFAHQLHADLSDVVQIFRDRAARKRGRVSIAVLPSVAAGWMPKLLARFAARHPNIQFSLTDAIAETCVSLVRNGDVDFGITVGDNDTEDLDQRLVALDHFYLVCHKDHELLRKKKVTAADIAAFPFLQLPRSSSVRRVLDNAFQSVKLKTYLETNYMATIAGMAEVGLGITIVPSLSLNQFIRPTLGVRILRSPQISRPIHLIRRRGRTLSAAAEEFFNGIVAAKFELPSLVRQHAKDAI